MIRNRIFILGLCLAGLVILSSAQDVRDELDPYVDGESLSYVGKYKRFGLAFSIAELKFKVVNGNGDASYNVLSEGNSKGTLAKLFNFNFYMKIDSIVHPDSLQVEKTKKRDEQGDRIRDSEADFDYNRKRVTYIEKDPTKPTSAPIRVASEIKEDTQDIVSAVYRLRGMDLAVGKTFHMNVSDSGLVYEVPVRVTARQRIKSELGKRWCWRVEPEIFGAGRIIEQKGSLTIWITDDADRVPVLAKLDSKLGKVDIKLRNYSNLRSTAVAAK